MERTTETASKLIVSAVGLDGKTQTRYELYAPTAFFCDVANQLDHCRNHGLEPVEPEASVRGKRAS